ncbi:unnamed protein product [Lampetra fluviatilis]
MGSMVAPAGVDFARLPLLVPWRPSLEMRPRGLPGDAAARRESEAGATSPASGSRNPDTAAHTLNSGGGGSVPRVCLGVWLGVHLHEQQVQSGGGGVSARAAQRGPNPSARRPRVVDPEL